MPAIRPCFTKRLHAKADQRLFALYLPGAQLTLHTSVHGASDAERQMLFEALSCLGPDDVLILDRGYPAAWLVAYLTEHNIRFCMRCEKSNGGWTAVRTFGRSDQVDAVVTLNKPNKWDCEDYGCSGVAPQVRLVKCVTPDGMIRVMATNLPISQFPTAVFGELYHERWRIEEAFKRLKHRGKLESVSGLTQHALMVDVHCPRCWRTIWLLCCALARQCWRGWRKSSAFATGPMLRRACSACCRVWCWGWAA